MGLLLADAPRRVHGLDGRPAFALEGGRLGLGALEPPGGFGIVDSERPEVAYEDFHGHKLDRGMLELIQQG
jgi:hypothetical protein